MKKLPYLILLFSFLAQASLAQQSKISFTEAELFSLGKTWGYLKYYHPVVSQGKLNWDSLLISSLNAPKKIAVDATIASWLKQADDLKMDRPEVVAKVAHDSVDHRNFNLDWIKKDQLLSAKQKEVLFNLSKIPDAVGTFYSYGSNGRYGLSNEKNYPDTTAAHRLLGLFRFWNVIEYFYPYKYAIGNSWDETLKKFIPTAIQAKDELSMAKFAAELAAALNDTHAEVAPAPNDKIFGKLGPPFKFKVINRMVIITKIVNADLCKKSNLEVGDVIGVIDGQFVQDIIDQKSKYISSSNESVKIRDAFYYLFNGDGPKFSVQGQKKNGAGFSVDVIRVKRNYNAEWDKEGAPENKLIYYDPKLKRAVYSRILNGNIGYVDRSSLAVKDLDSIMQTLKSTKGIIFDLRGYNDDGNLITLFNYILKKPMMYAIKTQVDFSRPGTFLYRNHVAETASGPLLTVGKANPNAYSGKVICLINESTQSAEEFWAMMFKTIPNVTFIGSQTAGADGNKTPVQFIGPYKIYMSGLGIYYPDGQETQRIGIIPDILVRPTARNIQDGKDVLVDQAIDLIESLR